MHSARNADTWPFKTQSVFSPLHKIAASVVAAVICTAIEYPAASTYLNARFSWAALTAVFLANAVTVGISAFVASRKRDY